MLLYVEHTSREGGLINEAKTPVQELDSQRGGGAYFEDTVNV